MSQQPETRVSSWPHRWAWLLACATFPLVWWGGFVTATGSGMAFKDWLTSDGVFMPLYPWLDSAGDKFIEHGHRLLGMLSGLLTIALVISLALAEPRRWVRWFGVGLLVGVILQGVLGGMRVIRDERLLALVHGCTGPLFFAACAAMVVVTSRRWVQLGAAEPLSGANNRLVRLAVLTAAAAYLQLIIGAVVRHSPLMLAEGAATVFQIAVYFHLLMAVVVTVQVLTLAHKCYWRRVSPRAGATLAGLILLQVGLGVSTWLVKYGLPFWVVSLATWLGRFGLPQTTVAAIREWPYGATESGLVQAVVIAGHGAIGSLILALCTATALRIARAAGSLSDSRHSRAATIVGATA